VSTSLQAPFPWFGGKSRVADLVWSRFGDTPNYVEPFFGSGAVLLGRPHAPKTETVNDKDRMLANFWRAVKLRPAEVAQHADWPVNEADLEARHYWLITEGLRQIADNLTDPEWCDPKVAGWWVWGLCSWIGGGWCSGNGPWAATGQGWEKKDAGRGIRRQIPHLGSAGRGIRRQIPHLGSAGMGIHRQMPHLGDAGRGIHEWMTQLAERLRSVRVCCGEWDRIMGPSVTEHNGITAVLLDPPYSAEAGRNETLYAVEDLSVAHAVREWCLANGDNPKLRIALCGYDGEHVMPDSWEVVQWKTQGGYALLGDGAGRENQCRERIWFSPACLRPSRRLL
jgi:hypothetical protein